MQRWKVCAAVLVVLLVQTMLPCKAHAAEASVQNSPTQQQNYNLPIQPINSTAAYLSAQATRGFGNGDLILLKNIDTQGAEHFGLIDTGNRVATNNESALHVIEYLQIHGVQELDWFIITHHHGDHMGDARTVIKQFHPKTLYFKQFDKTWSPQGNTQKSYEAIVRESLSQGCRVVGVGPESLNLASPRLSLEAPSMTDTMRAWLSNNQDKLRQAEPFTPENCHFTLGAAQLTLLNTEHWDQEGSEWISGQSTVAHEVSTGENNNSLGVLLEASGTRSFWSGDMNNSDGTTAVGIGDEDRLKAIIGDVDLLKLGHHGYGGSNTTSFLETLQPEYGLVTNDVGGGDAQTLAWLNEHAVAWEYTTADPIGVYALFYNAQVSLGYETAGCVRLDNGELAYQTRDMTADRMPLTKGATHEMRVNSWGELAASINQFSNHVVCDELRHEVVAPVLTLRASAPLMADTEIEIPAGCFVELEDMAIERAPGYEGSVFRVFGGELSLKNCRYNGREYVAQAPAIRVVTGELELKRSTIQGHRGIRTTLVSPGPLSAIAVQRATASIINSSVSSNTIECVGSFANEVGIRGNDFSLRGAGIGAIGSSHVLAYGSRFENNSLVSQFDFAAAGTHQATSFTAAHHGTAIYCYQSDLSLENCSVNNNESLCTVSVNVTDAAHLNKIGDRGIHGGGICVVKGPIEISGGSISHNHATSSLVVNDHGQQAVYSEGEGSAGGGLCVWANTKVGAHCHLEDVEFAENSIAAGSGGAAYIDGASELWNCSFVGNSSGRGGALETVIATDVDPFAAHDAKLPEFSETMLLVGCSFDSNSALASTGGAWYANAPSAALGCSFTHNRAETYGGAIMVPKAGIVSVMNSRFASNEATAKDGGAVRIDGFSRISDTSFEDNQAAGSHADISVRPERENLPAAIFVDGGSNTSNN